MPCGLATAKCDAKAANETSHVAKALTNRVAKVTSHAARVLTNRVAKVTSHVPRATSRASKMVIGQHLEKKAKAATQTNLKAPRH